MFNSMLLAVSLQLFDIYFLWKSFLYYFLKLFLLEGAVITFFVLNVNLLSPLPDALNSANWGIFIFVWYFVSHYWFEPMSIATNNWTSNHSTKSMSCTTWPINIYHPLHMNLLAMMWDLAYCVLCPFPPSNTCIHTVCTPDCPCSTIWNVISQMMGFSL